jgi:CDP-diacylglycerol---glycerol-3-phosphate 3-phosphatidyltransferase
MKLSNILTCSRMVMAVFFTAFLFSANPFGKILALVFFLTASITDYYDGKIARERGEISAFGQMMDPLADKVLTLAAFISFWWLGLVPWWMVLIVVVRDALVTLSRFLMPKKSEGRSARGSGKSKTALQMAFIVGVLLYLIARESPYWNVGWNDNAVLVIEIVMGLITALTVWTAIRIWTKNG